MPLPVHTTEEIGQVAHAVDELHTQALLLAGDEARLRLLVNDMFETMSRRSRSLVDQQLSLIDRLERNEEDPDRLDSLFRLDHLAARLRRNSANLLVLAGAQLARDQREPVALPTVTNAAVSEVEDYRRVEIGGLPECMVIGVAAGGVIHLFAELIDNALRYSPPTTFVRISALRGGDGGVLVRIADSGLGMNDTDQRIANMRLHAGGEVTPDNARHMGLFVVGRIAARHGIRVGLRGATANEAGSGTTAEIYLPPAVLEGAAGVRAAGPRRREGSVSSPSAKPGTAIAAPVSAAADQAARQDAPTGPATQNGYGNDSGRTDHVAAAPQSGFQWYRRGSCPAARTRAAAAPSRAGHSRVEKRRHARADTSAGASPRPGRFRHFGVLCCTVSTRHRSGGRPGCRGHEPAASDSLQPDPSATTITADDDVIYRRMLSEMVGDPHALANSPDLDWQSVWDRGWSLAAEAEDKPVESHTVDHGLPVRAPGARLVPGAANESDRGVPCHLERRVRIRSTSRSMRPRYAILKPFAPPSAAISTACVPDGRMPAKLSKTREGPDQS